MSKSKSGRSRSTPTTPAVASYVQSVVAKGNGGQVTKGSHVPRMQAAAARNFGKSGEK